MLHDADLDYDVDDDDEDYDPDEDVEKDIRLEEAEAELGEALNEEPVRANIEVETVDEDEESEEEDDSDDNEDERVNEIPPLRSTRERREVERLEPKMSGQTHLQFAQLEEQHNLATQVSPGSDAEIVYEEHEATVLAQLMTHLSQKVETGDQYSQQYSLKQGLKKFGDNGWKAAQQEMEQLHVRTCFTPRSVKEMTEGERKKAQRALMLLTQKRDGRYKGRMVYNGKPTREWLSREDSASPTAMLESIMLTLAIDAKEHRDVMTADVPNAFIQTDMPEVEEDEDRVFMKITGVLVDMLVELMLEVYGPYVVFEDGEKVIYVEVLKAIYGMLQAALLWYKQFRADLEAIGFQFNKYDPCVANKMVEGKQHTVRFHVDDLMSSHVDSKVNDKFQEWLQRTYGSVNKVQCTRGKIHVYLGMTVEFHDDGSATLDMRVYISNMINDFPMDLKGKKASSPATEHLFSGPAGPDLNQKQKEQTGNR